MVKPRIVLLIFVSGKVVLTGNRLHTSEFISTDTNRSLNTGTDLSPDYRQNCSSNEIIMKSVVQHSSANGPFIYK